MKTLTHVIVHADDSRLGHLIDSSWRSGDQRLWIRDQGQGAPPIAEVPEGKLPEPAAESGRGCHIIRALAETVDHLS